MCPVIIDTMCSAGLTRAAREGASYEVILAVTKQKACKSSLVCIFLPGLRAWKDPRNYEANSLVLLRRNLKQTETVVVQGCHTKC